MAEVRDYLQKPKDKLPRFGEKPDLIRFRERSLRTANVVTVVHQLVSRNAYEDVVKEDDDEFLVWAGIARDGISEAFIKKLDFSQEDFREGAKCYDRWLSAVRENPYLAQSNSHEGEMKPEIKAIIDIETMLRSFTKKSDEELRELIVRWQTTEPMKVILEEFEESDKKFLDEAHPVTPISKKDMVTEEDIQRVEDALEERYLRILPELSHYTKLAVNVFGSI